MKKLAIVVMALFIFVACKDGGGGDGAASVGDIKEGSGPSFDVTKSGDVETIVKNVMSIAEGAVTSGTSSGATIGVTQPASSGSSSSTAIEVTQPSSPSKDDTGPTPGAGQTSGDEMMADFGDEQGASSLKGLSGGSSSTNSPAYKLCKEGKYSKTYDKTSVEGSLGSAEVSGKIDANKTSDDLADGTLDVAGTFSDYYKSGYSRKYKLNGTFSKKGSASITGMKALCDSYVSGKKPSNGSFNTKTHEERTGSFSISSDIGGAIAFNITSDFTETNASDGPFYSDVTVSGSAEFVSGGKKSKCTITRQNDPDTDIDNYSIDCAPEK